ncbi:hypothetical protein [Fimbriiglobus ruber]|uniref:hypothetical protein n=1 Tax=Fimbriiglobus ruber TaxID=1908690 RepID=UPI001179A810|nr:hypothetical protein [Fimbriiglobus ruber]
MGKLNFLGCWLFLAFAVSNGVSSARGADKPPEDKNSEPISPDVNNCRLSAGDIELKPVALNNLSRQETRIGKYSFVIDDREIKSSNSDGDSPLWTTKFPADAEPVLLGHDERMAYFTSVSLGRQRPDRKSLAKIWRLNFATGKWLEDIQIGGPTPGQSHHNRQSGRSGSGCHL